MEIDSQILGYYDLGQEDARLTRAPSLELVRTQVLLRRFLPPPPSMILDVGGATGVYARWLADLGHEIDLVDPVALHVEQASARGLRAEQGDARRLDRADGSYDGVLLLGPLYHLVDRADRVRALAEARRVVRPGGVVIAAAISRTASFFDGFFRGFVDRPGFAQMMREDLRSGQHRNPDQTPERFTTAYFHHPEELPGEFSEAGLSAGPVLPVEGPLNWAPGISDRLADPQQRELILAVLEQIETDPALLAAGSHLLAVGYAG